MLGFADSQIMTDSERHQILVEWNRTERDYPRDKCIHQLFEEQVEQTPEAVAVVFEDQSLTYQELDARANQLAHYMTKLGVGPEVLVGIRLERSLEMVVALIAVVKAGGASVAIEPVFPLERLAFIMADTQMAVILTHSSMVSQLPPTGVRAVCVDQIASMISANSDLAPEVRLSPENLAYVIYTSGSTGWPKGVLITHAAYLNYCVAAIKYWEVKPTDRFLHFAPFSVDIGIDQLITPLLAGATVVIRGVDVWDPAFFTGVIRDLRLTAIHIPPIYWNEWIESLRQKPVGGSIGALRLVQVGGDVMPIAAARLWCELGLHSVRLINRYGPTETTMFSTAYEVPTNLSNAGQLTRVPIGRPVGSRTIYILNGQGEPVPVGVTGEIYIGGDTLARGYLNRPELTSERFVPDPFRTQSGSRFYRTGDLARYLPDGNIEFLGRADFQVKIRGYRIELGEIESVMMRHSAVREAVVIVREDGLGDRFLAAYVVVKRGAKCPLNDLRNHAETTLPVHMVPARFVEVEHLPLTRSGKVDRQALQKVQGKELIHAVERVNPRSTIEAQLAAIWQQVLEIPQPGIHDNFFHLGGHSLKAVRLVSRVRKEFGVALSVRSVFEFPTVAGLAEQLQVVTADKDPPLEPVSRNGSLRLSFAQERLWFLWEYEPKNNAYSIPKAYRLAGPLDADIIERAMSHVVQRHESLRTTFQMQDSYPVHIIAPAFEFRLPGEDLSSVPQGDREREAQGRMTRDLQKPFDLAAGPLIWAKLYRLGAQDHILLVNMHHSISDGWSAEVFCRELSEFHRGLYSGLPRVLPALRVQYPDYAVWQREWLQGPVLEGQLDYWRKQVGDAPILALPTDRPRPPLQTYAGARHDITIPPAMAARLEVLNRETGATPFMSLLAVFQVLLARYSGQEDILVGTPVANRQRMELEQLIGFFVNTLVMRGDLSGKPSFRELVRRDRQTALEAYQHQDLPFEALVKELNPVRDLSRHPLFQVMFAMQNAPEHPLVLAGLETAPYELRGTTTHFDLELHVWMRGGSWKGRFVYNTDLFDDGTIERMAGHYLVLLENLLTDPDRPVIQAPILTNAERDQILVEWNRTERDYPRDKCIHQLFEEQVERTPDAVAVVFEDESLSYRELDARANQLAHHLHELGTRPELLVALCLERSLEIVVAIYGTLKAGGAYVPIDPSYPADRVAFMLADANASVIITQDRLRERLPPTPAKVICLDTDWESIERESQDVLEASVVAENRAYVIYTSGSTGRPKGAMNTHRAICNRMLWMQEAYPLTEVDRVIQKTPFSFDVSVWEFFWPLLAGARLVIARPDGHRDSQYLIRLIISQQITIMHFVPSMMRHFLHEAEVKACSSLRRVFCSGEALTWDLQEALLGQLPGVKLHNLYGPTEAAVDVTHWTCKPNSNLYVIPIGRPIANTQIYILDEELQPVPAGVAGELHIGGVGVGRGYLNRPELTAERFISDPFSSKLEARLYKTGDLARYLADGNIEFLGRLDQQIKLRGFRIELGEIEAALGGQVGVVEAAVTVRDDISGDKCLVAYLVAKFGYKLEVKILRQGLAASLPDYMIPSQYVLLPAMPLMPNGKVNREGLERLGGVNVTARTEYLAPRTELERQLTAIWSEILQQERIDIQDNFFELGGHSLLAARLATEISKKFGSQIPIATLFQSPTIELLAQRLMDEHWAPPWGSLVPLQTQGNKVPLFFVHGWGGNVFVFTELARLLAPDQPAYGLQAVGLDERQPRHKSVEEMASHYADEIMSLRPQGPYFLCGYSLGGIIAYELGQQLRARGGDVAMVMMLDTNLVILPWPVILPLKGTWFLGRLGHHLKRFVLSGWGDRLRYLRGRRRAFQIIAARQLGEEPPREGPAQTKADEPDLKSEYYVRVTNVYRAKPCRSPLLLVMADDSDVRELLCTWRHLARAGLSTEPFAASHLEMLNSTNVGQLAAVLRKHLERAQQTLPPQPEA